MLKLKRIRIDNPVFSKTTFPIKEGLSVVYGLNRTSTYERNSNGVGKSALPQVVPAVLFGGKMTGFHALDIITDDGRKLSIECTDNKIDIKENGELIKLPTGGVQKKREYIAEHLPITELEYSSTATFNLLDMCVLIRGKSTDRRQFFENFFNLDVLNDEKRKINAVYRSVSADVAKLNELQATIGDKSSEAIRARLIDLKAKREVAVAHAETISANYEQYASAIEARELVSANRDVVKLYRANRDKSLTAIRRRIDDLQTMQTLHVRYAAYVENMRAYKEELAALPPDVAESLREQGGEKFMESLQLKKKGLQTLRQNLTYAKATLKSKQVEEPSDEPPQPSGDYDTIMEKVSRIRSDIKHYEKTGDTCPTCGTHIDVDIDDLRARYAKGKAALDKHEAHREWAAAKKLYDKVSGEIATLKETIQELEPKIKELAYLDDVVLPRLKPNKVDKPELSEDEIKAELKELRAIDNAFEFAKRNERALNTYAETRALDIPENYSALVVEAQETLKRIEIKMHTLKTDLNLVKEAEEKIEELTARAKLMPRLQALLKAYEDSAVKRLAITSLTDELMEGVNKLAQVYMPEDFRFEFVWQGKDLNILVHRYHRGSKKPKTTDTRQLSGAESTLFASFLITVLIGFVHPSRRFNTLFMDEPTSAMSEPLKDSFKRLVAYMNTLIPSIIITTPITADLYEGAHCFTVVKRNGVATIENGHPESIA